MILHFVNQFTCPPIHELVHDTKETWLVLCGTAMNTMNKLTWDMADDYHMILIPANTVESGKEMESVYYCRRRGAIRSYNTGFIRHWTRYRLHERNSDSHYWNWRDNQQSSRRTGAHRLGSKARRAPGIALFRNAPKKSNDWKNEEAGKKIWNADSTRTILFLFFFLFLTTRPPRDIIMQVLQKS